jgi:hypothetical protein
LLCAGCDTDLLELRNNELDPFEWAVMLWEPRSEYKKGQNRMCIDRFLLGYPVCGAEPTVSELHYTDRSQQEDETHRLLGVNKNHHNTDDCEGDANRSRESKLVGGIVDKSKHQVEYQWQKQHGLT